MKENFEFESAQRVTCEKDGRFVPPPTDTTLADQVKLMFLSSKPRTPTKPLTQKERMLQEIDGWYSRNKKPK